MRFLFLFLLVFIFSCEQQPEQIGTNFPTQFESSNGLETATYDEIMAFYIKLAKEFPEINIQTIGNTDSDKPLHIVTFNTDGDFNFKKIREQGRSFF